MNNTACRLACLCFLLITCVFGVTADAALIAYEDFNYAPGASLSGLNGGSGFNSSWYFASGNANYTAATNSLSQPPLTTNGNRLRGGATTANAWIRRDLPVSRNNPLGAAGSTLYVSALMRPTGTNVNTGYSVLSLVPTGQFGQVGREVAFGKPGNGNYSVAALGGIGRVYSNVAPQRNETVLLVLKAEFNANAQGNDTFSLFVNPDSRLPEGPADAVKTDLNVGLLSYLAIRSTADFELDEIRLGTTFEDVTPFTSIPEPGSGLLLMLLTAAVVIGRSRRK